jgi:hypothetical protein
VEDCSSIVTHSCSLWFDTLSRNWRSIIILLVVHWFPSLAIGEFMLNKYSRQLLKEVITDIRDYPESFSSETYGTIVKRKESIPDGVVGNIATKVVSCAGIGVWNLLKAFPSSQHRPIIHSIARSLLFGTTATDAAIRLFDKWPEKVNNDPIKRIKLFLETDGVE